MGRVEVLIGELGMRRHPEGGYYSEVYRSATEVSAGGRRRRAVSVIYFLLPEGEFSRLHRVRWDEVWSIYEGELELLWVRDDELHRRHLGRVGKGVRPFAVVPGGSWQAARPLSGYALVSCAVAPGFEWEDFEMLRESVEKEEVLGRFPELKSLL